MKRLIVVALEELCSAVHERDPLTLFIWTPWSRLCRLAEWSAALDERWNVGEWKKPIAKTDGTDYSGKWTDWSFEFANEDD